MGFIAAQIKARTGSELDARARDALHSALTTGAMLALARYGRKVGVNQDAMINEAINYAKASVPRCDQTAWACRVSARGSGDGEDRGGGAGRVSE